MSFSCSSFIAGKAIRMAQENVGKRGAQVLVVSTRTTAYTEGQDEGKSSLRIQKQITRQIMQAKTPQEVFKTLFSSESGDITDFHLTVALLKIARNLKGGGPVTLKHMPEFSNLVIELEKSLSDSWNLAQVANVLEATTVLRMNDSRLQKLAELRIQQISSRKRPSDPANQDTFSLYDLASFLSCLAKFCSRRKISAEFLCHVAAALSRNEFLGQRQQPEERPSEGKYTVDELHLSMFSDVQLGIMSWATAEGSLSISVGQQLTDYIFLEACQRDLSKLPKQTLAHLFRLCADKGSDETSLLQIRAFHNLVLDIKEDIKFLDRRDIVMLLTSYAKLYRKTISAKETPSSASSLTDARTCLPEALQDSWGNISMKHKGELLLEAAKILLEAVADHIPRMDSRDISSTFYSLALLQTAPKTLLLSLENRSSETLMFLSPRAIATMLWSLATLRYDAPSLLIAALCRLQDITDASCSYAEPFQLKLLDIQMTLFALAMLDCCCSWREVEEREHANAARRLLLSLVKAATLEIRRQKDPIILAQLGWTVVICVGSEQSWVSHEENTIGEFFAEWRAAIVKAGALLQDHDLATVHLVEVALQMEGSMIASDSASLPQAYEALMHHMYESGRVKNKATKKWETQLDVVRQSVSEQQGESIRGNQLPSLVTTRRVSNFQRDVYKSVLEVLMRKGAQVLTIEMEYKEPSTGYLLDIALPEAKVAIEADGPTHFTRNSFRPLGPTLLKRHLLNKVEWTVISIPIHEWNAAETKGQYLEEKFRASAVDRTIDQYLNKIRTPPADLDQYVKEIKSLDGEEFTNKHDQQTAESSKNDERPPGATDVGKKAHILDMVRYHRGEISRIELAKRNLRRKSNSDADGRKR